MAWRLIEVPEAEAQPADLTDRELTGVSIPLAQSARFEGDVFHNAWEKVQPAFRGAWGLEDQDGPVIESSASSRSR